MLRNNYRSHNLIGHYPVWVISPRNSTSFTGPFLAGRLARAGHETTWDCGNEATFFLCANNFGLMLNTHWSIVLLCLSRAPDSVHWEGGGGSSQPPSLLLPHSLHDGSHMSELIDSLIPISSLVPRFPPQLFSHIMYKSSLEPGRSQGTRLSLIPRPRTEREASAGG